jgi:thioredoxin 1
MRANFDSIINDTRPVVVDFYALWCAPCKTQSPILKEVATELGDKVRVIKIDVDQNPEIASRFQIRGVPTLAVFKNGVMQYIQAGLHSKPQLMSLIASYQ